MRIAVLVSGTGSNLKIILEQAAAGRLEVIPALVLSNKPDCEALAHARLHNVPVWARSHRGVTREEFDAGMLEAIRAAGAEAIILAGYMRILSTSFIRAFPNRILNIHPAILPSFAGIFGGQDALDYKVRLTGCTVHFVDELMDNGPVIIQAAVPVSAEDALEDVLNRIHAMEHKIYPQAIQWLAQGRLKVEGRNVTLLPKAGLAPKLATVGDSTSGPWMVCPALEDF